MARPTRTRNSLVLAASAALFFGTTAPSYAHDDKPDHDDLRTVTDGLNMPRGVASVGRGMTLVTEVDGTFSLVLERRRGPARVVELDQVPAGGVAPSIDVGPRGMVYILTGAGEGEGAASLFKWRAGWSSPKLVADIAAYQAGDPDPYDLENNPTDSNPFGVHALRDGSVLVADAAGNDLLRVFRHGYIKTVARFKPRAVRAAAPDASARGGAHGKWVLSESVPTSVTVGSDGHWYVAELRGMPGTPGTSQVWRIEPGSHRATCDPHRPTRGACVRYADGLTSIVDLAAGDDGTLYALSLSKLGWPALESEQPSAAARTGALYEIRRHGSTRHRGGWSHAGWDHGGWEHGGWNHADWGHGGWGSRGDWDEHGWDDHGGHDAEVDGLAENVSASVSRHGSRHDHGWTSHRGSRFRVTIRELVELETPGGVDVSERGTIYLVGPLFSPDGALMKLDD